MQGREQLLACLQWGEEERESNEKERDEQMHHSVIGGCKGYEREDACKAGEDSYHSRRAFHHATLWAQAALS